MNQHLVFNENIKSFDLNNIYESTHISCIYIYNAYMYRVRWSPSTNEFVGTYDQHKNKITSYKFEVFLNLEEIK